MEGLKVLRNTQIIILGLCITAGSVVSTVILSRAVIEAKKFSSEVVTVTGAAEKKILADYIVWEARFSRRAASLAAAFAAVKEDSDRVAAYLEARGLTEEEMIRPQANTKVLYKKTEKGSTLNDIEGYEVSQTVEVRSYDVGKVIEVSRAVTELLNEGIELISGEPKFFYTKLAELKVEMLKEAAQNAKVRAEGMAESTGNKIGLMRNAQMGVFQITPVNSYDVSWYGNNDTSSYEKKVTAVVNVTFAITG